MLRVTIEMVPFGNECNKKTIGCMTIGNDQTGKGNSGNYDIRYDDDSILCTRYARVENFDRDGGALKLVKEALAGLVSLKKVDKLDTK